MTIVVFPGVESDDWWMHEGSVHHLATQTVPCECGAVDACGACGGCRADERNPCGGGPFRFGHVVCDPYCHLCGSPYDYPPGSDDDDGDDGFGWDESDEDW